MAGALASEGDARAWLLADEFAEGELESAELEIRALQIDLAQHAQRLDRALAEKIPEFSRSYLQQLLALGAVSLNGLVVTKSAQRIKVGDRVRVEMRPTLQSQAFRPESMCIDVVHEDENLLVINKPAGLVVHPAPGNWTGTLLNGLLARDARASEVPRAGIVHRLDKDTSGLMVVARNRITMDSLVRMIAARQVSRQYLALAQGVWRGVKVRTVEEPIGRDPRNRLRMAVVDLTRHAGKTAKTDIECLQSTYVGCWVRCTLHTGRTHQIRVHMASTGHPLVADALYGGTAAAGMARQALHAFRLAFVHPLTGESMEFHAPLPPDMRAALEGWGMGYNIV